MGKIYKISSQFTDYVLKNSSNPSRILTQVGDAIEDLGEKGFPLPGDADRLAAFHESHELTDDFMMDHFAGDPNENARLINQMYRELNNLTGTGKIDRITRKVIDKFLSQHWKPLSTEQAPISPVQPIRRHRQENPEEPELSTRELIPSWERPENQLINRIDKAREREFFEQNASCKYNILASAGILEPTSNYTERSIRLAERKYQWAKFIVADDFPKTEEEITKELRRVSKQVQLLDSRLEEGKISSHEHEVETEYLLQKAQILFSKLDTLQEENIPVYELLALRELKERFKNGTSLVNRSSF